MRITKTTRVILAGLIMAVALSWQLSFAQEETTVKVGNVKLTYMVPAVMDVPERIEPKNDTDWAAKVNNKNTEVIEVLNILNPVAAYLSAAFEQYGDKFSEIATEEWDDTVAYLTKATTLYGDCQKRMEAEKFDKKLFLNLEESWQLLVKVGVAGIRTKTMVDDEFNRM
ncbi:MAG: hypothetical protein V3W18_14800 [candidate division Zixibacteria bacterium]